MNGGVAEMLVQTGAQVLPPPEEIRLANELEPRRELERVVLEHGLEIAFRHVLDIPHLVRVDIEIHVCLNEQDIVDCTRVSTDLLLLCR